jgi:polar amino acid transport system substrate-binding protein
MAAEIAYCTGYDKLDVVNVGWAPLVSGQTSDIDFAFSQISITDERKKVVDFSIPYFYSDMGVLV